MQKFNDKDQTANFSVLAGGRQPRRELFPKNMENWGNWNVYYYYSTFWGMTIHEICHLHEQNVWVKWILRQNSVNHNKAAYIVNSSCGVKILMWSNDKLPHIEDVEQFVIAPHENFTPHDK